MVPWAHISQPAKRHLDRFSRLCTAHPCAHHTHRQTDTQTTLRATSIAVGRMYAVRAMRPKNNEEL